MKKFVLSTFIMFTFAGFALCVSFFSFTEKSFAANIVWDGGGGTNNWSEATNWSTDSVPGINDSTTFNGTSTKNAIIDLPINIYGINISTGYTGIMTQSTGNTIQIGGGGFTQNETGSSFIGGNTSITVQGIVNLTSGVFTSTSDVLSIESHLLMPGGTFNHNSGSIAFTGGVNANFDISGAPIFNTIIINRSSGRYVNILDTIIVSGNLELRSGISYNGTLDVDGNVTAFAPFQGGNTTVLINSAISNSNVHLQNGSIMVGLKMMSPQATLTTDTGAIVTFAGGVELQNGTFNLSSGTTHFEQNITITGGTFNHNSGTVMLDGTGNSIIMINNPLNLNNLTVQKTNGRFVVIGNNATITVNGNLTLNGGSVINGIIDANGSVNVAGTFEGGNSTLLLDNILANTLLNLQNGSQMMGVKINSPLVSVTSDPGASVTFEGNVELNNGNILLSSGITNFEQHLTVTGGIFNHNSGTSIFNGAANSIINTPSPITFYHLRIDKPSSRFVLINSGNIVTVDGALQLNGGSVYTGELDANSSISVSSNFEGGNALLIVDNASTVQNLNLMNQAQMIGVKIKSPLASLTLDTGANVTFEGSVELNNGSIDFSTGTTHLESHFTITGGTFSHNSGTISIDGPGDSVLNLNLPLNVHHLIINKPTPRFVRITGGSPLIVHGDLQIDRGILYTGSIEAHGNVSFGNAFGGGDISFIFAGSNSQTYSNQTGIFFTSSVTVNKGTNSTLSLSSNLNLTNANQNFNILGGIVDMGSNNLNINGTITVTGKLIQNTGNITTKGVNISLNSEWENRSTGDITLGTNGIINNGIIDFDGGSNGCQTNNEILIRSTTPGTAMPWSGVGIFWLNDLDMQDQNALVPLTTYNSTNTGNNIGLWNFESSCASTPNPTEVTPVTSPTNDTTPNYTFHTIRPGSVSFTGNPDCISFSIPNNGVSSGNNTFTFNTLSEGLYTCQLIITDDNGNTGSLPMSPFVIDTTTLPLQTISISTTNPSPLFAKTGDTLHLTFEASEAINTPSVTIFGNSTPATLVSGNIWLSLYTTTGIETEGIIPFQISYQDTLGNPIQQTSVTTDGSQITYDKTAPVLTEITPIGNSFISNPPYTFSYYDLTDSLPLSYGGNCESSALTLSNGNSTLTLNGVGNVPLPDGTYSNCEIIATDLAGNSSTLSLSTFTVNTQAPILTEVSPIGSVQVSTPISYSFTSDQGGTLSLAGNCTSSNTNVGIGINTITIDPYTNSGTINNCIISVTNIGSLSNSLTVTAFQVTSNSNGNNGGGGGGGNGGSADNFTPPRSPLQPKTLGDSSPPSIIDEPFFLDTENHWSRPFAFDLSDAGIIFKAVYLRKDDITTQAETLKMALRSARVDTSETNSPSYYTNISEDDWVKNYANTAYDLHILNIPIGSHYEKNAGITRKDALILFMKAFKIIPDSHLQSGFTDIHDSTLESYAAKAKSLGIVKGIRENSFEPDRFMTRAEMVKFASLFRHTSSL